MQRWGEKVAMVGAGTEVIAKGFILLMLGVPVYIYFTWRAQQGQSPRPE